jgi:hypothetical protein
MSILTIVLIVIIVILAILLGVVCVVLYCISKMLNDVGDAVMKSFWR